MLCLNDCEVNTADGRIMGIQTLNHNVVQSIFNRKNLTIFKESILTQYRTIESLHIGLFKHIKNYETSLYIEMIPKNEIQFIQIHKEFVFDMDITDYKRLCLCSLNNDKKLCNICWLHMEGSYLILNFMLIHYFGYKKENLLWVFSGNKGIHCFMNGSNVLKLKDNERTALYELMRSFKEEEDELLLFQFIEEIGENKKFFIEELEEYFLKRNIEERNLLSIESYQKYCLQIIKEYYISIYHTIESKWQSTEEITSKEKWEYLKEIEKYRGNYNNNNNNNNRIKPSLLIIFKLYYPCIDKGPMIISHLIKLPFSIHSVTKNISLPFNKEEIYLAFDY